MKSKKSKKDVNLSKSTTTAENLDTATAFGLNCTFGTYEVQRTADTDNEFPCIAQGKAKKEKP